ncbi:hypothetical protein BT69DRAFT_1291440 [Atractiella rhizophila]|nr:hypothetical protein BT69DRAFT_1291440 [Atractiella rhizophila]
MLNGNARIEGHEPRTDLEARRAHHSMKFWRKVGKGLEQVPLDIVFPYPPALA